MHAPSTIILLGSGVLAAAGGSSFYAPTLTGVKRDLLTCEQTYGPGSVQCGNSTSSMCYKPNEGQVCCAADNGYCDKGEYCAPVAGYCCVEGEDLQTCATNAGFKLPAVVPGVGGSASSAAPASSASVESMAAPSASASASRVAGSTAAATTLSGPAAATNIASPSSGSNSTTGKPYVQVSVARKEQRTLAWTAAGIGAVALVMATF